MHGGCGRSPRSTRATTARCRRSAARWKAAPAARDGRGTTVSTRSRSSPRRTANVAAWRVAVGHELDAAHHDRSRSGRSDQGVVPVFGDLAHPRQGVGVVEAHAQVDVELDLPFDAAYAPDDVGATVADGHHIHDLGDAGRRGPGGDQREGAVLVAPHRGRIRVTRRDHPAAVLLVAEQGARTWMPSRTWAGTASRCCRRARPGQRCACRR